MRPSVGLVGLLLVVAPSVLAQNNNNNNNNNNQNNNNNNNNLPNLASLSQPDGQGEKTSAAARTSDRAQETNARQSQQSNAPATSGANRPTNSIFPTVTQGGFRLSGLPTLAGVGVPDQKVPYTGGAPFMHKSNLPDGTVFICVGAILAFFGACVLAWRGMVAWSLHRSVKRAAMAQNLADIKSMSAVPGKKRGMYNVVGGHSNLSLDHLAAAPIGTSKKSRGYSQAPGGAAPARSQSSLFFSPTAGGATGLRDSIANRSSNYLPAGYYATGNAAPASGSPMTQVGGYGQNLSANSLATPGNRMSARSGLSDQDSPSLPPSRGNYSRAPPSRDGISHYNQGHGNDNPSQLSLNTPGGTAVPGGRAPSAYLEDLFENHGNGPRERY
ncbi:uncharacterized protein K460DRAFT_282724 [Cucurbitaria berberidis CBS 394.84]|uniref:Uncharacterized protein n=1 Tax=Cucurbitaria berberidis CBS 394.84 TaxID=1168544 RepID=A0A9P4GH06_9PLEO|nr:uncharacterized protein K460DRAFT_282724 [Cucurbitaria berberidis CBS 394.84]KAF1845958.1 hypothetical protein K460DRAFT_282724 [Cucurbitaria berberidis CBS 394.84]